MNSELGLSTHSVKHVYNDDREIDFFDSELGLLTYSVKHVYNDDRETDSSQQTWPADTGEMH